MKAWFIALFVLLPAAGFPAEKSLSERYPNRLIGPDFGIVTADDLAYDATQRTAVPYDPNKEWLTTYWQCLPVVDALIEYRAWLNDDPLGRRSHDKRVCEVEIQFVHAGQWQIYSGRRAYPLEYCHEFIHAWERLTENEKVVCLNGDWGNYEQDVQHGKYKGWTWNKFKTHKGCYSYFGDCNVKGCAQGKCP